MVNSGRSTGITSQGCGDAPCREERSTPVTSITTSKANLGAGENNEIEKEVHLFEDVPRTQRFKSYPVWFLLVRNSFGPRIRCARHEKNCTRASTSSAGWAASFSTLGRALVHLKAQKTLQRTITDQTFAGSGAVLAPSGASSLSKSTLSA